MDDLESMVDNKPEHGFLRRMGPCLHLSWHVSQVADESLKDLEKALSEAPRGPIKMSLFDDRWVLVERLASTEAARRRLEEARRLRDPSMPRPFKYRAYRKDIDANLGTKIHPLVAAWERSRGVIDADFLESANHLDALSMMLICAPREKDGELVYRFLGTGFAELIDRDWVTQALGQPCGFGEPDERYTDWFRSSYLRVFENKVPERDICDTLTRYACDGRRDRRLQYDRVVLPARLSCGTPALVMDSHVAGELCPLGT